MRSLGQTIQASPASPIRQNRTRKQVTIFDLRPRFGWPTTLFLVVFYSAFIAGLFMKFEEAPVVSYYRTVSEADVAPGDVVLITSQVKTRKLGCQTDVARNWFDTAGNLIQVDHYQMPAFSRYGANTFEKPAIIPAGARDGILWMSAVVEFRCNPVQHVLGGSKFVLPDIAFLVKEPN